MLTEVQLATVISEITNPQVRTALQELHARTQRLADRIETEQEE